MFALIGVCLRLGCLFVLTLCCDLFWIFVCLLCCLFRIVVSVYNSVAGFVYFFGALVFCTFGLV